MPFLANTLRVTALCTDIFFWPGFCGIGLRVEGFSVSRYILRVGLAARDQQSD